MSATPIAKTNRFYVRGVTKIYWVEEIEDITDPTRAELDAGVDISGEVDTVTGWMIEAEDRPAPDFGSAFTGTVPGPTSVADSSLNMYVDIEGGDVRGTVFSRGTVGHIVWMDTGDVPGNLMDVYPTRVKSVGTNRDADSVSHVAVGFSITSEPAEFAAIPAAA